MHFVFCIKLYFDLLHAMSVFLNVVEIVKNKFLDRVSHCFLFSLKNYICIVFFFFIFKNAVATECNQNPQNNIQDQKEK